MKVIDEIVQYEETQLQMQAINDKLQNLNQKLEQENTEKKSRIEELEEKNKSLQEQVNSEACEKGFFRFRESWISMITIVFLIIILLTVMFQADTQKKKVTNVTPNFVNLSTTDTNKLKTLVAKYSNELQVAKGKLVAHKITERKLLQSSVVAQKISDERKISQLKSKLHKEEQILNNIQKNGKNQAQVADKANVLIRYLLNYLKTQTYAKITNNGSALDKSSISRFSILKPYQLAIQISCWCSAP